MPRYFDGDFLRRVRNDISWELLLEQLRWPHKQRQGQLAFLCPCCGEYVSAVNPRTNLGRCFHCETNFNPSTSRWPRSIATSWPPWPS